MVSAEIDAVVLMPGPNTLYFSDMHVHVSERPILLFLPVDADPLMIIPGLEAMKAEAAGISAERILAWSDQQGYGDAFMQAAEMLNLSEMTLGVEAYTMRVLELELLQHAAPGVQIRHAESVINPLRLVKDEAEIAAMARAVEIAEQGMEALLPQIKIGMTEKQIAAILERELMQRGAESLAFSPIVSGGPNSASPHAVPTNRPIAEGDLLVIDWGVYADGYPSDITRTYAVGAIEPEFERIHKAVQLANQAGKAVAKPGATGEEVDTAARDVIEEAGYGEYFIHRTGHGLGLEVHEPPSMVAGNLEPLGVGNVFTVEPGIYLPGRGGVRIEDDVVITAEGHRVLTSLPRDIITVG